MSWGLENVKNDTQTEYIKLKEIRQKYEINVTSKFSGVLLSLPLMEVRSIQNFQLVDENCPNLPNAHFP